MSAADTMRLLGLTLTEDQSRACRYLERLGQRFCVEFGYDNAIENARRHWNALRRQRRAKAKRAL